MAERWNPDTDVLWHGDGCDTPMAGHSCPRCGISPSMQDTFFAPRDWKPKVRDGFLPATDYKPGDSVVIDDHESQWHGKKARVTTRHSDDADWHVRVLFDHEPHWEQIVHQNNVKPVEIVERIGRLDS